MSNNDDLINSILNELDNGQEPSPSGDSSDTFAPVEDTSAPVDDTLQNDDTPDVYESIEAPEYAGNYPQMNELPPPRRMAPTRRKKKKKKKQRNRLPGILILTTFIFAVSIVLSLVIIAFGKDMLGIGKSDTTHLIVVKEGATTSDIAYMLKDEGIIRSPKAFILFSKLRKSDSMYVPGEHFIKENMAYETIIQKLTSTENAAKNSVEVTFYEGDTLYDIAEKLEENKVCKSADFMFYFNAGDYGCEFEEKLPTEKNPLKFKRMEGYAFPDTYMFYEGMDVEQVCQKIYFNFNSKMTAERYKKMQQKGLDLDKMITLASIVQKEAANTEDMNTIAGVFFNRLNNPDKFKKLESDPTSNYAKFVVAQHQELYNQAMIDAYDTYVGYGLPPGAICNPGLDAIDAVLDAKPTEYFFFVANIYTGKTEFSVTYEEHLEKDKRVKEEEAEYEEASKAAEQEAARKAAEQEENNDQ
jgi:UPF0755 protein